VDTDRLRLEAIGLLQRYGQDTIPHLSVDFARVNRVPEGEFAVETGGALGGDVKDLTKDISNLKWVIPIIITIGIAVMGIIVGLG